MPVDPEVMFTSLKSVFLIVNMPLIPLSGVSARYAVPDTSGDGSDPVDEKFTKTPVDGVIVTVGVVVYPLPCVTIVNAVTSPENTVIVPVAGVESVLETVYVNVVAVLSGMDEIIVPAAGVGRLDETIIVKVLVPVTVTLYVALYPAEVPVQPEIVTRSPVL